MAELTLVAGLLIMVETFWDRIPLKFEPRDGQFCNRLWPDVARWPF